MSFVEPFAPTPVPPHMDSQSPVLEERDSATRVEDNELPLKERRRCASDCAIAGASHLLHEFPQESRGNVAPTLAHGVLKRSASEGVLRLEQEDTDGHFTDTNNQSTFEYTCRWMEEMSLCDVDLCEDDRSASDAESDECITPPSTLSRASSYRATPSEDGRVRITKRKSDENTIPPGALASAIASAKEPHKLNLKLSVRLVSTGLNNALLPDARYFDPAETGMRVFRPAHPAFILEDEF